MSSCSSVTKEVSDETNHLAPSLHGGVVSDPE